MINCRLQGRSRRLLSFFFCLLLFKFCSSPSSSFPLHLPLKISPSPSIFRVDVTHVCSLLLQMVYPDGLLFVGSSRSPG